MAAVFSQATAGPGKRMKVSSDQLNKVTRLVRPVEPTAVGKSVAPGNYGDKLNRITEKRGRSNSNSVQDNIAISTMGESVNPFTVVGNGKTNLFANPKVNSISFIRRGGPNDAAGSDGAPGNRLYYDLNTRGGADGFWQISKGPVYDNDPYLPGSGANYGARYPQGLIWTPPGSSDTNDAVFFTQIPVLDGSNGSWGGQARGWQKLSAGSAPKQTYTSSALADPYHYISEGMDINPATGHLFFVDPERDVTSGSVVYNNRVTLYRMSYNSATNDWDSTITYIPFNATSVATSALGFGPDGVTGYVVVLATSPDYGVINVYAPFVSKTVDGGNTWSEFHLVDLNPEASADVDSLREQWLGSWVNFDGSGFINSVPAGSPYSHKVQYSTSFDLDIVVDKFNYCHIMTQMMIAGFTDTLEGADPPSVRSGLGQWLTDIFLADPYYPSGFVMNNVQSFRGCYGDCGGSENFTEDNRPQTTRSWDGSVIGFCWFDTDTASYDPAADGSENSNPDFWIRTCKVDSAGKFRLTSQSRNKTKGSNAGGSMVCGNVSPYMLPSPTEDSTYIVPVSAILMSTFNGTTAAWPGTHLYIDGATVTAKDSGYPLRPRVSPVTAVSGKWGASSSLSLALWPNPAKASMNATVYAPNSGDGSFTISNALGQVVDRKAIRVSAGDNKIALNTSAFKPGIYFMNVTVGGKRISRRFVKD